MVNLNQFTTSGITVTADRVKDGINLRGGPTGSSSLRVNIIPASLTANRTLTIPNVNGTLVTTGDLGSIVGAMIANSAITGQKISLGAIDTNHIADKAITEAKLAFDVSPPVLSPYILYVNPATGSDSFAGGTVAKPDGNTKDFQKLKCGYSESRPFKTINRAIIEAGILTAKAYYESPLTNHDLVSIVLAPGVSTVLNGPGEATVPEWPITKEPTNAELQAFNPSVTGGILLPRGVSLCSIDLRKTIIRPSFVPTPSDEEANAGNRRSIFKVTGTGYYYGFTFMDKAGHNSSHHLLHCFEFASKTELDEFYAKIKQAFDGPEHTGGLNPSLIVTRPSEYEIVGPAPSAGSQTEATDTTDSASPYIFNCSIRSKYGMCGIFADGSKPSGFRSIVTAQFTGVSLQKDLSSWQKYSEGNWMSMAGDYYNTYITAYPDNVRMNPSRRSFHVRAINGAFIQEVSVFAIGQGVHHWVQSGGEIVSNGGFSNFGGVAGLAEGYRNSSFPSDSNWNVGRIKVANNLSDALNNVKRVYLGTVASVSSGSITLTTPLGESLSVSGVPEILAKDGYTFRPNSLLWVENPLGEDWRAPLSNSAWNPSSPSEIGLGSPLSDQNNNSVPVTNGINDAVGKRVYIRRLADTRNPSQRRYTLKLNNTNSASRAPVRDYVLQVKSGVPPIVSELPNSSILLVSNSANVRPNGVAMSSEITLRRGNSSVTWTSGSIYLKGETVKLNNKHYTCIEKNSDTVFDPFKWQESYVHMPSDYNPEDFYKNEAPIIIFDNDTDGLSNSTTLGYNLATAWNTDPLLQNQYRNSTDYRAIHLFLVSLGFTSEQAHGILIPRPEAYRERNPANSQEMGGFIPNGVAINLGNWPVEFRRPSSLQLLTHNWAWSGYLNYTKSLPQYQRQLSEQNRFTYFFTNSNGGRVYPNGYNEEGYRITPKGIEDAATGQTLTVENLGANDISLPNPQTSFDSLSARVMEAGELTITSGAKLNGVVEVTDSLILGESASSSLRARTNNTGLGKIASIFDLKNTSSASSDEGLDTAGSNFVTVAGLKYWASWAKVLTQRSGATSLFVVPDNAVNGGTYNFDGTASVLTADPNRSGESLTADPPNSRAKAVKFSRAVEYANSNYSSADVINYYLANGPYYTPVSFTTLANVYGATNKFPANNALADFTQSNTSPTTNVKTIYDSTFEAPCFATALSSSVTTVGEKVVFVATPTSLNFKFGGSLQGVVWLGAQKTLNSSPSHYPDSIYSTALVPFRSSSISIRDFLDNYLETSIASSYRLDKFYGLPTIYVGSGNIDIWDCVFGPKASGRGVVGYGSLGPIVQVDGDCNVNAAGIYFMGNTTISSLPKATAKGITIVSAESFGCKNSQSFVGSRNSGPGSRISLTFKFRHSFNSVGGLSEKNYDGNCFHILDDNGKYGLLTNSSAIDGYRGASFECLVGEMNAGGRLYTGGFDSYQSQNTPPNKHHGFAGVFGNNGTSGKGPIGISSGLDPIQFYRNDSYAGSVWQQAITGSRLTHNKHATFAASITGTVMTLASIPSGKIAIGTVLYGANVAPGTKITELLSGNGGVGSTYRVSISQSLGVTAMATALDYTPGGLIEAYVSSSDNPLNVSSSVFFRGVDLDTARTVGGALEPLSINGTARYVFYG